MEVRTEIVVQEVKRYVAKDGKVFQTETDCMRHEVELARAVNKVKIDMIERCDDAEGCAPADGAEYMDYHDYYWYRPKNRDEADLLHEWFEFEGKLDDEEIGKWVCIEDSGDMSWCVPIDWSIIYVKKLFDMLGYEVTITKKEDSNV